MFPITGFSRAFFVPDVERAHLIGMELRPWDNIRINLSQSKPNPRPLNIKFEFLENFEIQT